MAVMPTTEGFIRNIERFVYDEGVDLVTFQKGQRKDEITQKYVRKFAQREGVLYVGKAQEKARVMRTERRRSRFTGGTYQWIVESTVMVNHYYFYCVDELSMVVGGTDARQTSLPHALDRVGAICRQRAGRGRTTGRKTQECRGSNVNCRCRKRPRRNRRFRFEPACCFAAAAGSCCGRGRGISNPTPSALAKVSLSRPIIVSSNIGPIRRSVWA
jgi:hypothetical protein